MKEISRFVVAISAPLLIGVCSSASASEYLYNLNGSYTDSLGNGPALVPFGGTLTPGGYFFGPNQGLSLSNVLTTNAYSIEIRFFFDSTNSTFDGYQRILDFKNRASDTGFYSL